MRATILTDASYCPETFVAGYGYWIASDRGKLGGGGRMQGSSIANSTAAEMMAVANSLWIAAMHQLILPGDQVLMQTDCESAIQAFEWRRKTYIQQEIAACKFVQSLVANGLAIRFKHVKGHSGIRDPRHIANHMCDKRAKDAMREARSAARSTRNTYEQS